MSLGKDIFTTTRGHHSGALLSHGRFHQCSKTYCTSHCNLQCRETYSLECIYGCQLTQFTNAVPRVKSGRSTHFVKNNLSLNFLYEFTVQIVVHLDDHTLKLKQDGSSKASKIYISLWEKKTLLQV